MINTNPFSVLAETIPPITMQIFIVAMIILIAAGTIIFLITQKKLNLMQKRNWVLEKKFQL
jgi:hypothetical protein